MPKFIEEVPVNEITDLFEYEDNFKEALFNGQDVRYTLEILQERIQKIYVVPTAN